MRFVPATVLACALSVVACSSSEADGQGSFAAAGDPSAASGARTLHEAESTCPAVPAGVSVGLRKGEQIPELIVQDCDGNKVSLAALCGNAATWLYLVHGWCPHVRAVSTFAESLHQSLAPRGLASVHVMVENDDHRAPTAEDCKAWQARWGLSGVQLYFDQTGTAKGLMDSDRTSVSSFLDATLVITDKTLSDDETTLRSKLEGLLSRR